MAEEELIALIDRRFDELRFLLLDPGEQLKRIELGDSPIDEPIRRITAKLVDLESRVDEVQPPGMTRFTVNLLQDKVRKLESAQDRLEARVKALERSTSGRK